MSRYYDTKTGDVHGGRITFDIVAAIALLTFAVMAGCPRYNVWQQGLEGQAELERAKQNRQIAIQEAQAIKESSQFKAEAEIIRAEGVKQANAIIAGGLEGHDEYLHYLWIQSLEHVAASPNGSTVIYVPTEANLPISEAPRLK